MRTKPMVLAALVASSMLTACTQAAAPVVNKGSQDFSRSYAGLPARQAVNDAARGAPVSLAPSEPAPYQSTARVESIGVSDLAPPDGKTQASNFVTQYPAPAKEAGSPFRPSSEIAQPATAARSAVLDDRGAVSHQVAQKTLDDQLSTPSLTQSSGPKSALIWPVKGKVVSAFGPKGQGVVNDGVNIAAKAGDPVRASADGTVVYAGNKIRGYGNMVLVKHAGTRTTTYAHLSQLSVAKNAKVKQGDVVGYVGKTGNVATPQLHFAVREGKTPVNPERLIPASLASAQ